MTSTWRSSFRFVLLSAWITNQGWNTIGKPQPRIHPSDRSFSPPDATLQVRRDDALPQFWCRSPSWNLEEKLASCLAALPKGSHWWKCGSMPVKAEPTPHLYRSQTTSAWHQAMDVGRFKRRVKRINKSYENLTFFFSSGFLFAWSLYKRDREKKKKEKTEQTVAKMLKELEQKKEEYHICVDSYFGGIPALQTIVDHGFRAVMACRKDRPNWIFEELHGSLTNLGDYEERSGKIETEEGEKVPFVAISFKSSRNCNFLSTLNGTSETVEVEEEIDMENKDDEEKKRTKIRWVVPAARREYLENMNFVDLLDREVLLYFQNHKKTSWESALFFWFLKAMLVNTRVIHQEVCFFCFFSRRINWISPKTTQITGLVLKPLDFLNQMANLLAPVCHIDTRARFREVLQKDHTLVRRDKWGSCCVCLSYLPQKKHKGTRWFCCGCEKSFEQSCFAKYHNEWILFQLRFK